MDKLHTFLMVGCDDNGVHTEVVTFAETMADACVAFTKRDVGPIKFITVAQGLRDAGDINNEDLAVLEVAHDSGKIDVGEINRYKELVDKVGAQIVDIASLVFNFGQFASGDAYNGRDHNNYVDGDSVSQWKIYQITPEARPELIVVTFPTNANERHLIKPAYSGLKTVDKTTRKETESNEYKETRHSLEQGKGSQS